MFQSYVFFLNVLKTKTKYKFFENHISEYRTQTYFLLQMEVLCSFDTLRQYLCTRKVISCNLFYFRARMFSLITIFHVRILSILIVS